MNENIDNTQQFETMREDSFMKKLLKNRLNQKGLTLIELLAVIVILAIIAAIAVPAIGGIINRSEDKALMADASNILSGAKLAVLAGDCVISDNATASTNATSTCTDENIDDYVENIDPAATYAVTKDEDGLWVVTYSGFDDLNQTITGLTDNTINETALNTALNN